MDKRRISLCLTSFQRYTETLEAFVQVANDERVSEIIIVDDCSGRKIYEQLELAVSFCPKVRLFQNEENVDCYRNKAISVGLASNEWVVVFDSDNIMTADYLDKIFAIEKWDEETVYQPSFASPNFNFTEYEGSTIGKHNVALYLDLRMVTTMFNAMNYFVNRKKYLEVWQSDINPHTADSILQNYNHFKSGGKMYVVPGLHYEHRINSDSHYKNNVHLTGDLYQQIENQIRQLK